MYTFTVNLVDDCLGANLSPPLLNPLITLELGSASVIVALPNPTSNISYCNVFLGSLGITELSLFSYNGLTN